MREYIQDASLVSVSCLCFFSQCLVWPSHFTYQQTCTKTIPAFLRGHLQGELEKLLPGSAQA